jgi:hypothetical protein
MAKTLLRGYLKLWGFSRSVALGVLAGALLLLYTVGPKLAPHVLQLLQPPPSGGIIPVGQLGPARAGGAPASSREAQCRSLLETLFQKPFPKRRPGFLTHPRSGHPLELDMYNEELRLAVEHDGLQHRAYVPWLHKTEDAFVAQQERDRFKDAKCREAGVTLVRVPDTAPSAPVYLVSRLRHLGFIK